MGYGSSNKATKQARQEQQEQQQRVNEGRSVIDQQFAGFNDDFYNQRAEDYQAYALPQFAQQQRTTRNQLAAGLARRGLLKSGAAIQSQGEFDRYAGQKQAEIADAAIGKANQLRGQVEDQRSTLVNQLIASGDPAAASSGAMSAASALKQPSSFGALGNFFSDWTDNWRANQVAQSYDDRVQPMFSFGGNKRNNVSYVN